MLKHQTAAEVLFTAFKILSHKEREAFLEKLLSDPEMRGDLINIVLIKESKKVKGRPVPAKEYFTKRLKRATTD